MRKSTLSVLILLLAFPFFVISCAEEEKVETPKADETAQPQAAKEEEKVEPVVDLAAEEAAIKAAWERYGEGVRAGDINIIEKAWLNTVTQDIQFYAVWGDNERVSGRGWPSVKKLLNSWLTPGVGITHKRFSAPIGNIVIKGSKASGTGRGNYIQSNMNFVALFKKVSGQWSIQAVSFDAIHPKPEIIEPLQP